MATGGSSTQNVNIGANFTGQAAFQTFQSSMGASITVATQFGTAIGQLNLQGGRFQQIAVGFGASITNTARGMATVTGSTVALTNVLSALTTVLQNANIGAGAFSQSVTAANGSISNSIVINQRATQANQGYFLSLQNIARIAQAQIISRYTQAIGQALDDGVVAAANFDIKIAAIRTISQDTATTQEQWRQTVRALSDEFGNPLLDTAVGTYEAISNQVAKGAAAARFMGEAMLFAKTTLSTTADAVNLLSSVLNAYQISSEETTKISATLFRTIELGRTTATEMANIFGPTAVSAHLLGISLEEVGASVAILTSQGTHTNTSLTLTSNLIQKLVKPSEAMKDLFKEWGVASGEAAIATYGFNGVVEKLAEVVQRGGLTELADKLKDLRAIRGAAGLTGGNVLGDFSTVLGQIKEGSASYLKAQEIVANSAGFIFKKEVNKIQNILTIDLGNAMLEFLTKLSGGVGGASKTIKELTSATFALISSMGTIAGAVGYAAAGFENFTGWLSTVAIGAVATASAMALLNLNLLTMANTMALLSNAAPILRGIGLAVIAVTSVYALWIDRARKAEQENIDALKAIEDEFDKAHKVRIEQLQKGIEKDREAAESRQRSAGQAMAAITLGWDAAMAEMGKASDGFEKHLEALQDWVKKLKTTLDKSGIEQFGKDFAKALDSSNTVKGVQEIQIALKGMSDIIDENLVASNFKLAETAFDEFKSSIKSAQKEIEDALKESIKREEDAVKSFANRKFDLTVDRMGSGAAKTAITAEVERLKAEAIAASKGGDQKTAQEKIARAEELARELTNKGQRGTFKSKLDLSLEESVLQARKEVEGDSQKQSKQLSATLTQQEASVTQQITIELQKQLDLTTAQATAKEKILKVQQMINDATKVIQEELPKKKEAFETEKDSVAKQFSQAGFATRGIKVTGRDSTEHDKFLKEQKAFADAQLQAGQDVADGIKSYDQIAAEYHMANEAYKNSGVLKFINERRNFGGINTDVASQSDLSITAGNKSVDNFEKLRKQKIDLDAVMKGVPAMQAQLDEATRQLQDYAKGNFGELLKQVTNEAVKPIETTTEALKRALLELRGATNTAYPNQQQEFAQGGMVTGASGFDNLYVKAMAGEAFVSKEMTARYYPQIKAMNQGTYNANQTNTYNLSFNVDGRGTSEATVRDIGAQLGRAVRRGQIPGLGRA